MQYSTAAFQESGTTVVLLGAQPSPAATIRAVSPPVVAILGSAPAATKSFMAGTSSDCAARQKGVAPTGSAQERSPKERTQIFLPSFALTAAPFAMSAFMSSRCVIFSCAVIGCGNHA